MMTNDLRHDQGAMLFEDSDAPEAETKSWAAIDLFKGSIGRIRDRFFTVEEFPILDRDRLPLNCLRDVMQVQPEQIPARAAHMKARELEGLLLDLRDTDDPQEIRRAVDIICLRQSPRLLKLLTELFIYNFDSPGLNLACAEVSRCGKEKDAMPVEGAFIWRFGEVEDKPAEVRTAIDEAGGDISRCFQIYRVDGKSPFAKECSLEYLGNAGKDALLVNKRWIIDAIELHGPERLRDLIANYLSTFALIEYNDGVNLAIQDRIGQPYISHDWEPYPVELRDKFAEWCYLHQLKLHTFRHPKKLSILGRYSDRVRTSYEMKEENLLIIDFGEIVVADIADRWYSYFYQKDAFEKEMALWDKSRENAAAIREMQPEAQEQLGFAGVSAVDELVGESVGYDGSDGSAEAYAEEYKEIEIAGSDQVTIADIVPEDATQQQDEGEKLKDIEQAEDGMDRDTEATDAELSVEDLPEEHEIDVLITYEDLLNDRLEELPPAVEKTFEEKIAEEVENGKYLPTFLRMDRKSLTARDFIIEEVEEPCIKLSYEGVDVLYIQEMMDIKMGIEPDMRRKQLAKAMKRKKTGGISDI